MRVDAQTITSVLVLILFVTSLPTTTASSVTFHQKTALRVRNVILLNVVFKSKHCA